MNFDHILLHHSLSKDGSVNDWEAIRKYHMSYRVDGYIVARDLYERKKSAGQGKLFEEPWSDIGYNFGIEQVNDRLILQVGRPLTIAGAHCKEGGMNERAIGVCVVGNFDEQPLDDSRYNFLVDVCLSLCLMFKIPPENIQGHRQYATYKSCPGKNINPTIIGQAVEEEIRIINRRISGA